MSATTRRHRAAATALLASAKAARARGDAQLAQDLAYAARVHVSTVRVQADSRDPSDMADVGAVGAIGAEAQDMTGLRHWRKPPVVRQVGDQPGHAVAALDRILARGARRPKRGRTSPW